jgi:hypothetical protein
MVPMSSIMVPRPNVTVEEVSAVLRDKLGSHYKVTPAVTAHFHHESSGRADSILVKRHWFEQASIRVIRETTTPRSTSAPRPISPQLAISSIAPASFVRYITCWSTRPTLPGSSPVASQSERDSDAS